jgi:hypothetical protein
MNKTKTGREYNITGTAEDLDKDPVLIALGRVAVNYDQTGKLGMDQGEYDFYRLYFIRRCSGERRPGVLASDLVKMAAESVKQGRLVLNKGRNNYSGLEYVESIVKVLMKSIENGRNLGMERENNLSGSFRPDDGRKNKDSAVPTLC